MGSRKMPPKMVTQYQRSKISTSNIHDKKEQVDRIQIIQKLHSKIFRPMVNASLYVFNLTIHKNPKIPFIKQRIEKYFSMHVQPSLCHLNLIPMFVILFIYIYIYTTQCYIRNISLSRNYLCGVIYTII